MLDWISVTFSQILKNIDAIIFYRIGGDQGIPLIVLWLIGGGLFFTLRMQFINIRAFKHAIDVIWGKYDDPNDEGEVSHFQAMATALSGTVGLGNIAGVAIAISFGGPGAAFWMTIAGLLGMSTKFVECTLAQKYRVVNPDGTSIGGPMYYISMGLADLGQKRLGQFLGGMFALFNILAVLGSSSIFQSNQSQVVIANVIPFFAQQSWLYGLILVLIVGLVIIGGIQRIAGVAAAIVPTMCGIYFLAGSWIILANFTAIPHAFSTIIHSAFAPQAMAGGFLGALIQGFRRAAFSNEAGLGLAAIAHATAKTDEPVREGIVAMLEPFIDTVIICNMTALVVIITGVYNNPEFAALNGSELTLAAFTTVIDWFPAVLTICIILFAFSTMISSSYYGQVCWQYLFGNKGVIIYKILFLAGIFVGTVTNPEAVIEFSDAIKITLAFPSLLGAYFLCGKVATDQESYMKRLQAGEMFDESPSKVIG
ncbi:MAG: alanine:cation symporter family protein [Okeania sp. SIO3B5]|uniref:alanine/glycine:cation symporter family protein n=1 Tax=Okeania sp. SIO3B5 TaxID=2607811 RepID=UPI001400902E|nr:alanine/glycine:cation symporter family protein [Okeania sp. SIO3B5]NEO58696.1 alanine:cation symporter family protein [Okeania sp. SIO3B5]